MANRAWSPGTAMHAVGVVEGIVLDNKDPEGIGRILVQFVWLPNETQTAWARMSTPMAGKNMGWVIYPEPDDEVLLDFVNGDVNEPVILGSLFNGKDTPPFDNADGENNIRTLVSRSGHIIEIDDTDGAEKITVTDTSGGLIICMDTAAETITMTSSKDITFKADADFIVEADNIEMKSGTKSTFSAGSGMEASAGSKVEVKAGASITVEGAKIDLN